MTYDDAGSGARTARRHDRQEGCLDRPRDPLPTRVDSTPPLPEAYRHALDGGLAALGLRVPAAAREAIDAHVRLLLAWSDTINLTAIRDPAEVALRHVVDSLTADRVLQRHRIRSFIDLGSGGGFPGLPLAALSAEREALLVDSIAKKIRFLQVVASAADLAGRVRVVASRAEALAGQPGQRGRRQAVTARAVGSLAELVELSFPLLRAGGLLVAWKSAPAVAPGAAELAAAERAIAALDPAARIEVEDAVPAGAAGLEAIADHRLVVVRRGRDSIADRWPRDPATRRRNPW